MIIELADKIRTFATWYEVYIGFRKIILVTWRWPAKRRSVRFALIFFTQPPIPVAYFIKKKVQKKIS
jgi:hypothetical protein